MAIKPEKVVRRYRKCRESGLGNLLKILFNNLMFHNFNDDVPTSIACSNILSAIDGDAVEELAGDELSLLDQHLIHRRS